MKRKHEATQLLKNCMLEWQRQSGFLIKSLHTDRGTDFVGELTVFMKNEGIRHVTSPAYTLQPHGRSERYNETLLGVARCMLRQFHLPAILWSEALLCDAHVRNMIPRQGEASTPTEKFLGTKPDISYLKVFGCKAIVAKPVHMRKKLQVQGDTRIFVGMAQGGKGWRMTSWQTGKINIIESSDVVFHESETALPVSHGGPPAAPSNESDSDDEFGNYQLVSLPDSEVHAPTEVEAALDVSIHEGSHAEAVENASAHEEHASEHGPAEGDPVEDADEDFSDLFASDNESQWDLEAPGGEQPAAPPSETSQAATQGEDADNASEAPDEDTRQRSVRVTAAPNRLHMNRLVGGRIVRGRAAPAAAYKIGRRKSTCDETQSMKECRNLADRDRWEQAWNEELAALIRLGCYPEVDPEEIPHGLHILQFRLIFRIKRNAHGEIEKYKCRSVARGDQQIEGFDFLDVHAPTSQSATFRLMLALASEYHFDVQQLDVATAFLNGDLDEAVYIRPTRNVGLNNKVWKLDKASYGLRQSARA